MEFDENKSNPPSTRHLLYNQVKEQSDLCDVTVRCGLWEKKFHWCVIVASPFFESIRKHSYRERESGVIVMGTGSPVIVEDAILFLYGKKPKINSANIAGLLELAEYLLIPGIKTLCVKWIRNANITDDTCLAMIKLSSLYEFNLPTYEKYLKGRLSELIHTDDVMDLDEDSITDIFEGTHISSYVKATDIFSFIVRWVNYRQDRKPMFEKLMGYIQFCDVDENFVTDVILKEPLVQELDASSNLFKTLKMTKASFTSDVLIFPSSCNDHKIPCFDITKKRWCAIDTNVDDGWSKIPYDRSADRIKSSRDKDQSEVYLYEKSYADIYALDLEDNFVIHLQVTDEGQQQDGLDAKSAQVFLKGDNIVVICHGTLERVRKENAPEGNPALPIELLQMFAISDNPFDRMIAGAAINRCLGRNRQRVSVLKTGKIRDGTTTITPIFSIKGEVSSICANETTILMIQNETKKNIPLQHGNVSS